MNLKNKAAVIAATVCMGAVGALLIAAPASATDIPKPDPRQSAAYEAWLHDSTQSEMPAHSQAVTVTGGISWTLKHGTPALWTATTWDWYWAGSKMSSSTGSQSLGYIFPNRAWKGNLKRTLATSAQHNWTSTMDVGAVVPSPWGDVDVYRDSKTDKVTLLPGGKHKID